jgi:MurNAc alpha-1-phosphate uridylyltransferase
MKAFLLAAGKGERLQPLTYDVPKALINVKGKPLIQWNIERLKRCGIRDIIINLHHLGQKIEDFLEDGSKFGVNIQYSKEEELLGTGGGIVNALDIIGDMPFILLSSDLWAPYPFEKLSLRETSKAHMVLRSPTDATGDLNLSNGFINNLNLGPRYSYAGIALIKPEIFLNVAVGYLDLWQSFLKQEADKGFITGEIFDKSIINVNNIIDIQKIDDNIGEE